MGERTKSKKEIVSKTSLEVFPGAVLNRCGLLRRELKRVVDYVWGDDLDHYAKQHSVKALDVVDEIEKYAEKTNEELVKTKKKLADCQNLLRRLEKHNEY